MKPLKLHWNKYLEPHQPTAKQLAFCLTTEREVFFGGAAGGGKSSALLMAALQYVDEPNYAALILRKHYKQLALPGALMSVSHDWLGNTDAHWDGTDKQWKFPSGAVLAFGHLGYSDVRKDYQSSEFGFIGVDECTDFDETDVTFFFSRLRRKTGSEVPLRFRAASNPGGHGHAWVKSRWVDPRTRAKGSMFMPSNIEDNPYLDRESYEESLQQLHPLLWRQLLHGDWDVTAIGEMFQPRIWMAGKQLDEMPESVVSVRYWDLAATEPSAQNPDPDWTAGVQMVYEPREDRYIISHVNRFRQTGGQVSFRMRQQAETDGVKTRIVIEQEPGSAGKSMVEVHKTDTLLGFSVSADRPTGDKVTRAAPFASYMESGKVFYIPGEWTNQFFDELESFPSGAHDDQVDAAAGAFKQLRTNQGAGSNMSLLSGSLR